jgi:hypothetical protein
MTNDVRKLVKLKDVDPQGAGALWVLNLRHSTLLPACLMCRTTTFLVCTLAANCLVELLFHYCQRCASNPASLLGSADVNHQRLILAQRVAMDARRQLDWECRPAW